ncbi:MAG: cell envelope integrity protein TolA [Hyphomicrobiaceae bacterium]
MRDGRESMDGERAQEPAPAAARDAAGDAADDAVRRPPDAPQVEAIGIELGQPAAQFTRTDLIGLGTALSLHVMLLASLMQSDHRIGGGGWETRAIGVDLVVLAAALDGRISDNGEAGGVLTFGRPATPGEPGQPALPQDAAPDLRRDTVEQPVIASEAPPGERFEGEDSEPATGEARQPSRVGVTAALADSAPAEATDGSASGSTSAGSGDSIDVTSAALAMARAGRRDRYGARVFTALRGNLPAYVPGLTARVTVVFTIAASGHAEALRVTVSSGSPAVDEAALAAVRSTVFPLPPDGLGPGDLTYSMEYSFR